MLTGDFGIITHRAIREDKPYKPLRFSLGKNNRDIYPLCDSTYFPADTEHKTFSGHIDRAEINKGFVNVVLS